MSIDDVIDRFKKEWRVIRGAPWSFITCLSLLALPTAIAIWEIDERHYRGLIDEKDATIKRVEADRDSYKNRLQEAGVTSTPLKKRALVLVADMTDFADNWPTNAGPGELFWKFENRFRNRFDKIVAELEEQGQHSKDFESDSDFMSAAHNVTGFNAGVVYRTAKNLRTLAEGLKD